MMTKVRFGETARTLGAQLDLWWGITRRLTVAVLQRRPVAFVEIRAAKPPLSIMHGRIEDLRPLAEEVVRHATEAINIYNAQISPTTRGTTMRTLEGHKVNPANDVLQIAVLDEPGAGGACHLYHITGFNSGSNPSDPWTKRHGQPAEHSTLLFQNGPIAEVGVNGITHEELLSILIDRLEAFQAGKFANDYNATALAHLQSAQGALLDRTRERMARGVEGTHAQ